MTEPERKICPTCGSMSPDVRVVEMTYDAITQCQDSYHSAPSPAVPAAGPSEAARQTAEKIADRLYKRRPLPRPRKGRTMAGGNP